MSRDTAQSDTVTHFTRITGKSIEVDVKRFTGTKMQLCRAARAVCISIYLLAHSKFAGIARVFTANISMILSRFLSLSLSLSLSPDRLTPTERRPASRTDGRKSRQEESSPG